MKQLVTSLRYGLLNINREVLLCMYYTCVINVRNIGFITYTNKYWCIIYLCFCLPQVTVYLRFKLFNEKHRTLCDFVNTDRRFNYRCKMQTPSATIIIWISFVIIVITYNLTSLFTV